MTRTPIRGRKATWLGSAAVLSALLFRSRITAAIGGVAHGFRSRKYWRGPILGGQCSLEASCPGSTVCRCLLRSDLGPHLLAVSVEAEAF